jgi:Niemann-Pick C1 protein
MGPEEAVQTGGEGTKSKGSGGRKNPLKSCSNAIVNGLEAAFYRLGVLIGRYPWWVILFSFILLFIFVPGVPLFFYQENRGDKLWVADTAQALIDKHWVENEFPLLYRFNNYMIESDNVLTPTVLQAMLDIDKKVKLLKNTDPEHDWDSICIRLGPTCWSSSLLELWSFNEATISALTQSDIINKINSVTTSPVYGSNYNVSSVLGEMTRDGSGDIIAAKATTMTYIIKYNISVDGGEEVDLTADDWEEKFLKVGEDGHADINNVYRFAFRSFGDIGGGAILGDLTLLSTGYILIIVFVCIVLGRFNTVNQRVYVCLGGIVSVIMAIGLAFGLCAYAGVFYGPLHSILPFLVVGLGVDDMFVIVGAWDNLAQSVHKSKPVYERIGLTLKDAGVSITVTSLTDVLAFGIGASTILPALQSFCIYCCLCILGTFIFQATFFVACLAINERRADVTRDACCCCYTHTDYSPNSCSQKLLVKTFFSNYFSPVLLKLPVKIIVLIFSCLLMAGGIYGTVNLDQDFDPVWFFPSGTYAKTYFEMSDKYFPDDGIDSNIYMGDLDYHSEFSSLQRLYGDVSSHEYTYPGSLSCWYCDFHVWFNSSADPTVTAKLNAASFPSSKSNFYALLQTYLYSGGGARYIRDINFKDSSMEIKSSRMSFSHSFLAGASEEIAAMDGIRDTVQRVGFPGHQCFPYSQDYFNIETTKVIGEELYRNLGLAFLCVFLMTLLLIANLWTCILVAICVAMTLVDVLGMIYFWGLTIDTVTSIMVIVAIGLAVDYSAHIGHSFMVERGTRDERTQKTLANMGSAVFYGGFSTFLAFILLAASDSYVFSTFFKVFFGVVVFGLYHGLVFLPVLLSWMGPDPYDLDSHDDTQTHPVTSSKTDSQSEKSNGVKDYDSQSDGVNGYTNQAMDTKNEIV